MGYWPATVTVWKSVVRIATMQDRNPSFGLPSTAFASARVTIP